MPRSRQPSFASGEITPALHARVDAEQYLTGLALAENWFVSVYGGLLNRPGTRLIEESERPSRLIPFQIGEAEGYALELADNLIRFYGRGGRLLVRPVQADIGPDVGIGVGQWRNVSTGGGAFIQNVPQVAVVPFGTGTAGGANIEGGGLAAAFDGVTDKISALSANVSRNVGSAHKVWPATKRVVGFRINGSSDLGLTGRRQPVTLQLVGSNSVFSTDFNVLGVWTIEDAPGIAVERFVGFDVPSYTAHGVVVTGQNTGADIVSIAELTFFDLALTTPGLQLVGASGATSAAEQEVGTGTPNEEHVLSWYMGDPGGINFQVGHTSGADTILPKRFYPSGWNTVAFTPRISPFFIRFDHSDLQTRTFDGRTKFLNSRGTAPAPYEIPQPYSNSDLAAINWTQDANRLTLVSRRQPVIELSRGPDALTWSLELKRFGPVVRAPLASELTLTKFTTSTAIAHQYVVTFISAAGEESLPSPEQSTTGPATLTTTEYIRITVSGLPADVVGCNLYKRFGGSLGLMGFFVATFDDTGQAPKVDQPPPQARDPFVGSPPTCATYWEQRLCLAGSDAAPETVDLSRPGAANNFGVSSPPRDDDAITFTPSGPSVRRIKHMVSTADLAMFTDAAVVIARRGESALTPSLDGGVRQVLTRGIGDVRPLIVDGNLAFVGSDGGAVRLLDPDYQDVELSLQAEHLFRGRTVVDWCWQEAPWSLLWLVMSDGQMVTLALLPRQGVVGWTRFVTDGEVKSVACIREDGADRLYLRCRRWLRGAWRSTVELMAERQLQDVRDSFFVDCGLSLDNPIPIANLGLANPGTLTLSGHGLVVGGQVDVDGTGLTAIDGRRFTVQAVAGSVVSLSANWSNLTEPDFNGVPKPAVWRGGGVARRCVTAVTGLNHLAGMPVAVLNTGNVEEGHVVSPAGAITLQTPGSRIHVGLPYTSRGQTLRIPQAPEGFGNRKRVSELQVLARDTRALEFGPDFKVMDQARARSVERYNQPIGFKTDIQEFSVQGIWRLGGELAFRQAQPLPAEILSINPAFEGSSG